MDVQVGDGFYTLFIDTGSSNTWVGANTSNPYRPSKLSRDTGQDVNVTYGSGNFTGHQCKKNSHAKKDKPSCFLF